MNSTGINWATNWFQDSSDLLPSSASSFRNQGTSALIKNSNDNTSVRNSSSTSDSGEALTDRHERERWMDRRLEVSHPHNNVPPMLDPPTTNSVVGTPTQEAEHLILDGMTKSENAFVSEGVYDRTALLFDVRCSSPCDEQSIPPVQEESPCDSTAQPLYVTDTPSDDDILLGRGRLGQLHKGNVRFIELIRQHRHAFQALPTKAAKTRMAEMIVTHIKTKCGGHFLQGRDGGGWIEVPHRIARTKVATCFRTMKKSKKKRWR